MDAVHREKVMSILKAASAAPSGDNTQPWRFVVHMHAIEFHYLPEKDNAILNYEEGGTLIALGAALQNAELEARAQGYAPSTTFRESGSCVAVMELKEGGQLEENLAPLQKAIFKRHSNRKPYKKTSLPSEVKSAILSPLISGDNKLGLSLVESRDSMQTVARALTTMEEIALGNPSLHKLFFDDILWSEEKNRAGEQGLYIKTLELPPPAEAMFQLLKHWRFAKLFAKAGFPRVVAQTNAEQNASAAAFGIITAGKTDRATYLEVGKKLERIWLLAAAQGLSVQVVTGIVFLAASMRNPEVAKLFTDDERKRIASANEIIKQHIDAGREPILIFRIGEGKSPTEISYRRVPDVIFNEKV